MDRLKLEARALEDNSPSWPHIVAETAPGPGASFSDLLSWTLDLAESSDLLSERGCAEFQGAAANHLARITGEGAEKLTGVLSRLFTVAHRRAPAGRKAPGANVRSIWTALEGLWDGSDRSDKDSQNGANSRELAPGLEEAAARMRSALFR